MHTFLPHPAGRAQACVLAFSLAINFPPSAMVNKRKEPLHRGSLHVTSLLPGIVRGGPWTEPTYADSTDGDSITGEDLIIRHIAAQALGPYNGSVVIVDSSTGGILSILNQRLALGIGYQPCSTFKVSVALAALCEKVIDPGTTIRPIDLTNALARSSNHFV